MDFAASSSCRFYKIRFIFHKAAVKSKALVAFNWNTPQWSFNTIPEASFWTSSYWNASFIALFQCPDQSCKQDLLAYLEQIKLYSHQLKICSQVKAEIQHLGGELIMSAVSTKNGTKYILLFQLHVTFELGFPPWYFSSLQRVPLPLQILFSFLTPS